MLLRTLKSLFSRPVETEEALETRVLRLLSEKRPEEAKAVLASSIQTNPPEPEHLALLGEVEYHLKNTDEAERLFLEALRRKPGLAGAHYGLSLIHYDAGRHAEALAQAQFARNCAPGEARILAQMGLCCIALQNFGQAREALRQAALLAPDNVPALNNLGIALFAMNEPNEALYYFQRALALRPDYEPARENLRTLFGIESYTSQFDPQTNALQSSIEGVHETPTKYSPMEETRVTETLEAAFDERPEDVDAAVDLVRHHMRTLRLEDARDVLQIALTHNPLAVPLLLLAGRLAHQLGQYNRAKARYQEVLEQEPDNVEALLGMGQTLRDLEKPVDALPHIEKAAALQESSNTLVQLAIAQVNACRYEEALASCARIEATWPRLSPFLLSTKAVCHTYLGHFDQALQFITEGERLESLNPSFAIFRGMLHLQHENYAEGWEGYRLRHLADAKHARLLPYPLWEGQPLTGKTILILAEQGLGDQVMFASCLPDLLALGPGQVLLEAHSRVEKTLARSFPQVRVFPSGQKGFDWLPKDLTPDYYAPIADLARHFRPSRESFPDRGAYLTPDPARVDHWRARLAETGDLPRIGFTWRGGLQQTRQVIRSLRLEDLMGLLAMPGLQFVNLQYGDVRDELGAFREAQGLNIVDWPEAIADLDEFAALISALDLVITVCNTTVHYAGALGKPCWVMTPFIPEWRYGIDSPRMRWYPSCRMFRQPRSGDWDNVLTEVSSALSAWQADQRRLMA